MPKLEDKIFREDGKYDLTNEKAKKRLIEDFTLAKRNIDISLDSFEEDLNKFLVEGKNKAGLRLRSNLLQASKTFSAMKSNLTASNFRVDYIRRKKEVSKKSLNNLTHNNKD